MSTNQKKAKRLRRKIYGDNAHGDREYTQERNHRKSVLVSGKNGSNKRKAVISVDGSVLNHPDSLRSAYQEAKKARR